MHQVYNDKVMPLIARDAAVEFNKIQGYEQIIENNKNTISSMNAVVTTLEQVKENVDTLNEDFKDKAKDSDYENQLQAYINTFGRVSANMVNGDDIAEADNLLKQIIDEENYVYKDLLKGPLGCEQELQNNNHLSDQLNTTKRMTYPFPILYTYDIEADKYIPDPWNSGFSNKTNAKATTTLGPGFLSYYIFQNWKNLTFSCFKDENTGAVDGGRDNIGALPCAIKTDDLLPGSDAREFVSLGTTNDVDGSNGRKKSGPFENTIGIY